MNSVVNINLPFFYNLQNKNHIICPKKNDYNCYKASPTKMKEKYNTKEYELTQNIFDPTKQSPPNEFMQKLHKRVGVYN
jgi:hypothetical protein